jgi:hypothetical protein
MIETKDLWALLIGFGTGLFLLIGGSFVLKRTFKLLDSPEQQDTSNNSQAKLNWSFGQAMGLASLWTSKIILACAILYFSQKWGFSTKWLGAGIPVGVILGAILVHKKEDS